MAEANPEAAGKGLVNHIFVMAGLVPAIHVLFLLLGQDVDARDIGERKRRRPSDGYARV